MDWDFPNPEFDFTLIKPKCVTANKTIPHEANRHSLCLKENNFSLHKRLMKVKIKAKNPIIGRYMYLSCIMLGKGAIKLETGRKKIKNHSIQKHSCFHLLRNKVKNKIDKHKIPISDSCTGKSNHDLKCGDE